MSILGLPILLRKRHSQLSPRVFVCKDDKGTVEFRPAKRADGLLAFEFADVWDFGPPTEAVKHCSYTYHIPYGLFGLTTSLDPNLAVAADRNPWIQSPASAPGVWTTFRPDIPPYSESTKGGPRARILSARMGNSITHGRDGQNVLFLDGCVTFQRRAYCGVDKDNIYTISTDPTRGSVFGYQPIPGTFCIPANKADSVLVHDPNVFPPEKQEPWR